MEMEQIKDYIKEIKDKIKEGDYEAASSLESSLCESFIKYVSKECGDIQIKEKAKKVLTVLRMDFPRW